MLDGAADLATGHAYFVANTSRRHTLDASYTNDSLGRGRLTLKGVVTSFGREVQTNTVAFCATQTTYYTEASYLRGFGPRHTLVLGLNASGEQLTTAAANRPTPLLSPYRYGTLGGSAQDNWHPTPRLDVQAGLRLDRHNQYGNFPLPRVAILYKLTDALTARLTGGLGYRVPVPYVNSLDERDYPQIQPLRGLTAETSRGRNGDLNYQHTFLGFGDESEPLLISLNQSFFYAQRQHPLVLPDGTSGSGTYLPGSGPLSWQNATASIVT